MICLQQSGRCCGWQLLAGRSVIYMSYIMLYIIIYMVYNKIMNDFKIHTVNWFDRNPVLDEASVNVDHKRQRDTVWTCPHLCQLEGNSTVRRTELKSGL